MAAPDNVTIENLSGTWVMSKSLSDDMEPSLIVQGIPWIVRKVACWATITGQLKQTIDDNGTTLIHIDQTATGGIKGEAETHKLDWEGVTHNSPMFGSQTVRTRWANLKSAESGSGERLDPYLTEGWVDEEPHIQVYVQCEKGWTAEQIWGFGMIEGQRYHVRRFFVKNKGEEAKAQMVYEWQPKKN